MPGLMLRQCPILHPYYQVNCMNVSESMCRELAQAIKECIYEGRFAHSVIQKKFAANRQWTDDQKSLFAESFNFIVRNWRRLWSACAVGESDDMHSVMRICLAALMLSRVSCPPALVQRMRLDPQLLRDRWLAAESQRVLRYSYPDWLDTLGATIWKAEWDYIAAALHEEPKVVLRVNTLKLTRDELMEKLQAQGVKCARSTVSDTGIVLHAHHNVFRMDDYRKGYFEVQDDGSQRIAPFCKIQPGQRVIDACAGSGGKSLHLASLMANSGRIIAMDTEQWKLEELSKRARRAGIAIIETREINTTKVVKRLHESADCVLLDVPCSGLGVLRRNPDTKWHLQPSDIDRFVVMQRDILSKYALMAKSGGRVVYSTCSILPVECEEQVAWFLSNNPGWTVEEEQRIMPHHEHCDGFYMARLVRP